MSTLYLDVDIGDIVEVGGSAKLTIEAKTGRKARVKIEADRTVRIIHTPAAAGISPIKNPKLKRA